MKPALLLLFLSLSLPLCAQITFEEGYFITQQGEHVPALIEDLDWKNNPTTFEYKLSENGAIYQAGIDSVWEFGIGQHTKYIRAEVEIDRSTNQHSEASWNKQPEYKKEVLFLKALVEGKASLYLYEDKNLRRFFYQLDTIPLQQLVYKIYKVSSMRTATNSSYRNQLYLSLSCQALPMERFKELGHSQKELSKLFVDYNQCKEVAVKRYERQRYESAFHVRFRPGLTYASLDLKNSLSSSRNGDFGRQLSWRIGAEAEFVLPFNRNKWSILLEPAWQQFTAETRLNDGQGVSVQYNSLELSAGLRHYFFLNEESSLFLNALFYHDFPQQEGLQFEGANSLRIDTRNTFGLGLGYQYNHRYSLELRYASRRELLSQYTYWDSGYQPVSLIFGYSIL